MALRAIPICGMRHRIAYASSHNARRRFSDVVADLLRGLRGDESARQLGGDYRPALGGVPAFPFLVSLRGPGQLTESRSVPTLLEADLEKR